MNYAFLIPVAYLVFVFIADDFNPFTLTNDAMKQRRWQFGRIAALRTLIAGVCSLVVTQVLALSPQVALVGFLGLTILLLLPGYLKYKRT